MHCGSLLQLRQWPQRRPRALALLEVICKLLCLLFAYLVRAPFFFPSRPALFFFFIPTHWAPEVPTALHKTPGGDFFFSFYCPSPGKGLPGSASKSLSCCNGAVRPSRKMRNWECTEVKEKASPGKGLPLVLGVLATAGQGHPALITRPGRRRGTEREF